MHALHSALAHNVQLITKIGRNRFLVILCLALLKRENVTIKISA